MASRPVSNVPVRSRLAAAIFMLALSAAMVVQLGAARLSDEDDATRMVAAMTQAVAQQMGGQIQEIDNLLDDMAREVGTGAWDDPARRLRLEGRIAAYPGLMWMGIASSTGTMHSFTLPFMAVPPEGVDVSDRDYFQAHFRNGAPSADAFIGAPVTGRLSGLRTVHLSRAVRDADGVLKAVVVAALSADGLAQRLDELLLDPQGATALIRADGLMLARSPDHAAKFGMNIAASDLFTRWLPQAPSGVAQLISKADGNDKFVGYRLLERYPLVVTSGLSSAVAFRSWRRMAWVEIGGFILFAAAAWYWATMADLRNGQLLRAKQELEEAVALRTADLQQAKQVAEQRAAQIETMNAKLARLAQVAAHNLQEPVRSVVSFSQLLRRRLASLPAEADDDLRFIEEGGRRLKTTLEGFRQYTELLSTMPSVQPVDLRNCVDVALASLSNEISQLGAEIRIRDLPVVSADPQLLTSMVAKLADNALKYRHPERHPVIEVSGALLDHGWQLTVEDNGIGVPSQADQLFVPFGRTTGDASATGGLGLAFCQAVAEVLGGRIRAERLDQGSRFTLTVGAPA